jgi:acetyl-CoA carboxylase biotin carboxyl carrier protein
MSAADAKPAHEPPQALAGGEGDGAEDHIAAVGQGDELDVGHAVQGDRTSSTTAHPDLKGTYARRLHTPSGRSAVAAIEAHITGTVWKIEVGVGDTVEEGDTVVILESMKMEMPVEAEDEGTVKEVLVKEGQAVSEGDPLVVLE